MILFVRGTRASHCFRVFATVRYDHQPMITACVLQSQLIPQPSHRIVQRVPSHRIVAFPSARFILILQIATVIHCPSVEASSKQVYMKVTPRLMIEGSNFNIPNTKLVFDPPLNSSPPDQVISTQVRINITASVKIGVFFLRCTSRYGKSISDLR